MCLGINVAEDRTKGPDRDAPSNPCVDGLHSISTSSVSTSSRQTACNTGISFVRPSTTPAVGAVDGRKIGLSVCYHWEDPVRARAIETGCYVPITSIWSRILIATHSVRRPLHHINRRADRATPRRACSRDAGQLSDMDLRLLKVLKTFVECGGMAAAELDLNIGAQQ